MNLLDLPTLTTDKMLDHLDSKSLKTLRLTCKTMKDWVQNPKHMQKIQINIKSESELEEMMRVSEVEWNNVRVSLDLCSSPLFHLFLDSSKLKKLEIHDSAFTFDEEEVLVFQDLSPVLLKMGPSLESFHFSGSFDRRKRYPPSVQWDLLQEEDKEIIRKNLRHLKHLHFDVEYHRHHTQVIQLLTVFLQNSHNLQTLKFPVVFDTGVEEEGLGNEMEGVEANQVEGVEADQVEGVEANQVEGVEADQVEGDDGNQIEEDIEFIVDEENDDDGDDEDDASLPLILWLESIQSSGQPCPLKWIDCRARPKFGSLWWGAEGHCWTPFSHFLNAPLTELIINLFTPLGIKLYNVDIIDLPDPMTLTPDEKKCFDQSVKSVTSLSDEAGVKGKYIPSGCSIHVRTAALFVLDHSGFELPAELNVKTIHFAFNPLISTLDELILYTLRPSVIELRIFDLPVSMLNETIQLSSTFPKLKRLWLGGYGESEERVNVERLIHGLYDLEELHIVNYQVDNCSGQILNEFKKLKRICSITGDGETTMEVQSLLVNP